ncbi:MAG: HEAT repeat domain-containing protein [Acidimicrobiaceae bacterium]|nr:HEAT repeat domain-containing protein [Acidimicrobiaceae bacterium]
MAFHPDAISNSLLEVAIAARRGEVSTILAKTKSPHGQVRAAAIKSLAGDDDTITATIEKAFSDPDPAVRVAAAYAAIPRPRLNVTALLRDSNPEVVETACFAAGEIAEDSNRKLLEKIASAHPEPTCRESAVAALGVIGAPESLEIIIAALGDKPYVRRRAVVALAAFDDPRAEEAIKKCLVDRDHQVRQLAEDLLRSD